jgi:hypothetical protein
MGPPPVQYFWAGGVSFSVDEGSFSAHAHVNQRVADNPAVLPLDEGTGDIGLPIRIIRPTFVGTRAFQTELDPEGGLDAVDPQPEFRLERSVGVRRAAHGSINPFNT